MSEGSGPRRISRARSIAWSLGGQTTTTAVSLLSAAWLSRLLTPTDFGAYAFALTVTYLTQWLLQTGMGGYILREAELGRHHVDGAFAMVMGQGLIASLIVVGLAPVSGWFSHYATIGWVTLSVAILPFFGAPEAVNDALWLREGRYSAIAILQVGKVVAQAAVAIFCQLVLHWGVFALVAGSLAFGLTAFLVSMASLLGRGTRPRVAEGQWRELRDFGGRSFLLTLSQIGALRLPELMIARLLSVSLLGHYNRASGALEAIARTLSGSVMRAAQPRFYEQVNAGLALKDGVAELTDLLLFFAWPAAAGIAVISEPLLRLMYGPQWGIAGHVLPLLCLSFALDSVNTGGVESMLMRDRMGLNARIEALHAVYAIGLVVLAAPFGLMAVLWSRVLNTLINLIVTYWAMASIDALPLRRLPRILGLNGLLTLGAAGPPALLMAHWRWPGALDFGGFASVIGVGVIGWLAMLLALGHPFVEKGRKIVASRLGVEA